MLLLASYIALLRIVDSIARLHRADLPGDIDASLLAHLVRPGRDCSHRLGLALQLLDGGDDLF